MSKTTVNCNLTDTLLTAMRAADTAEARQAQVERRGGIEEEKQDAYQYGSLQARELSPEEMMKVEEAMLKSPAGGILTIEKNSELAKPNDFNVSVYEVRIDGRVDYRCRVTADVAIGLAKDVAAMLTIIHKSYFPN